MTLPLSLIESSVQTPLWVLPASLGGFGLLIPRVTLFWFLRAKGEHAPLGIERLQKKLSEKIAEEKTHPAAEVPSSKQEYQTADPKPVTKTPSEPDPAPPRANKDNQFDLF